MTSDEKIEHIIRTTACAVRIGAYDISFPCFPKLTLNLVPTRSTSYSHLRDAFIRAIQARLAASSKQNLITEAESLEALTPIGEIKGILPNTPLLKHQSLDLFLAPPTEGEKRALTFRSLGSVQNDFVATELVLHYFSDPAPSPPVSFVLY
jgi:hypothetical protein